MARPDAIQCAAWLEDVRVRAFLRMLRVGEGTVDPDGYRRHFGGELFESFADHPRKRVTKRLGGRMVTSTAAGAYQFLAGTWDECAEALGLRDFSPKAQDLAAVFLIWRRKAIDDVLAGRLEAAVAKCAREWASLPGSPYGQPTKTLEEARELFAGYLVTEADAIVEPAPILAAPRPSETETKGSTMPIGTFIAAALPSIVSMIPELGKLFGSGSKVAERNVAAATLAVDVVRDAIGAKNAEEAVEIMRADPEAREVARRAIAERWFELSEVGGGIAEARKADAAARAVEGPWWNAILRSPSFWALVLLLPLVYLLVLSIIGVLGPVQWSDDVRASIAGLIVGTVVGGSAGYYWGQTTSRNRSAAQSGAADPEAN